MADLRANSRRHLTLEPFATRLHWKLPSAVDIQDWENIFCQCLEAVAQRCDEAGVIGHIKGLALFPDGGYLRVSVISAARPADVDVKERVPGRYRSLTLTLNVLVYGLPPELADRFTRETAVSLATRWRGQVTIEAVSAPKHEHKHDEES